MTTRLNELEPIAGPTIIDQLRRLAEQLAGQRLVHINSTRMGGGVAELLDQAAAPEKRVVVLVPVRPLLFPRRQVARAFPRKDIECFGRRPEAGPAGQCRLDHMAEAPFGIAGFGDLHGMFEKAMTHARSQILVAQLGPPEALDLEGPWSHVNTLAKSEELTVEHALEPCRLPGSQ